MPARYPVHIIDEHIWDKTDSHPDERDEDRGSKIEDRGSRIEDRITRFGRDPRSSILDLRSSILAPRATPQKHPVHGRKSPEPQHPPITIRPGDPERR